AIAAKVWARRGRCTTSAAPLLARSNAVRFKLFIRTQAGTEHFLASTVKHRLRYMRWKTAALLLLVLSASALAAPRVETTGPCTDSAVADAVRKALAPQGYRVILDDGSTVDLWPPAQIQSSAKTREDATYPLAPSLFFGVIHFAKNARDARGTPFLPVRTTCAMSYSRTMAIILALRPPLTSCCWSPLWQIQIQLRATVSIR